jgi:signal transduction histidine kinase
MEGVDPEWVEAGTVRSATYTTIPSGRHVFRVTASGADGIWSAQSAQVSFTARPYFWQTTWFLAGLAAVTAASAVWGVRHAHARRLMRRVEELRQQHLIDRERARIAQDIHDELGANLTSIGLLADIGERHKSDPGALSRDLQQISQTARESVAAMDVIVWALNPRNDSLDQCANYVAQFTREFFAPTQLRTRFSLPHDFPIQPMDPDVRHQLLLILKESFNNIIRHAEASEVTVELASEGDQLWLRVSDNGKGFYRQENNGGQDGLRNLRERIEKLEGTLRVTSVPGGGTKLDFALPLRKLQKC